MARVPVRAFTNPENRLMVYRQQNTSRFAGPAFLLNQMLVWGFTGQVISALLDVAGWAQPGTPATCANSTRQWRWLGGPASTV